MLSADSNGLNALQMYMRVCHSSLCLPPAVTVLFTAPRYSTAEGDSVRVCVMVSGALERNIIILLTARSDEADTATGMATQQAPYKSLAARSDEADTATGSKLLTNH